MLEQSSPDVMVDALIFFINNTANGTHTPYSPAPFSPTSSSLSINCLFFASLSASIVAALASVVALKWVAEYDAAVRRTGSSPEDRVNRRQFRYGGVESWKMREIIAALPIFLHCSLVLFFAGVVQWMWSMHTTVGAVVLGGTLLGVAFCLVPILLAVVTYTLLRKIDSLNGKICLEEQVKLRVGCLNQVHRTPHPLGTVMTAQAELTSRDMKGLCDHLIPILAGELESSLHDDDQERIYDLIGLLCWPDRGQVVSTFVTRVYKARPVWPRTSFVACPLTTTERPRHQVVY
jgi:hypothetical protein